MKRRRVFTALFCLFAVVLSWAGLILLRELRLQRLVSESTQVLLSTGRDDEREEAARFLRGLNRADLCEQVSRELSRAFAVEAQSLVAEGVEIPQFGERGGGAWAAWRERSVAADACLRVSNLTAEAVASRLAVGADVGSAALCALCQMGESGAHAMVDVLERTESSVAGGLAATGLMRTKLSESVIRRLIALRDHGNWRVRFWVETALATRSKANSEDENHFVECAKQMKTGMSVYRGYDRIQELAKRVRPGVLRDSLDDEDPIVRFWAARLLIADGLGFDLEDQLDWGLAHPDASYRKMISEESLRQLTLQSWEKRLFGD